MIRQLLQELPDLGLLCAVKRSLYDVRVNLYPANKFCLENIFCLLCLLDIFICTPDFIMDANTTNPDPKDTVRSGFILFAIQATKLQKQMTEQMTKVLSGRKKG